ncbi:hypothetical protein K438DRAFT_1751337 [Mycena galopus ATCC 62051]|nr:hypothetical protein K438DRAFT_1751337 [Mycena galopus ATCC 62051]
MRAFMSAKVRNGLIVSGRRLGWPHAKQCVPTERRHRDSQVETLLSVLCDTGDSENEGGKRPVVVRTSVARRKKIAEWQAEIRELDTVSENDGMHEDLPPSVPLALQNSAPLSPALHTLGSPLPWCPSSALLSTVMKSLTLVLRRVLGMIMKVK